MLYQNELGSSAEQKTKTLGADGKSGTSFAFIGPLLRRLLNRLEV